MSHRFSDTLLPQLGPATGLLILGFRANAFGQSDCCCVQSGFRAALGRDADEALGDLLVFTRLMGRSGRRRIALTAPGCERMTRDELSLASGLAAAQAWDLDSRDRHLGELLAGPPTDALTELVTRIADTFAGHGLAFHVPRGPEALRAA